MFAALSLAQSAPAAPVPGYVVRVESSTIYLDMGQEYGAQPGQSFQVFTEGQELKHPVTGEPLGKIENPIGEGRLKQVLPKYSVGVLAAVSSDIRPGMRARLGAGPPAPVRAPASNNARPSASAPDWQNPRWKSPPFDFKVNGMAIGDFRGEGRLSLALATQRSVALYSYPPEETAQRGPWDLQGVSARILSLEAADLNGNGRAELFVVSYNEVMGRMETIILEWEGDDWKKLVEIPWAVRSYQEPGGGLGLAAQRLIEDANFPLSSIYPLTFKDGRYGPGPHAFKHKRLEWLYDFTLANLGGKEALIYLTNAQRLRVQFDKSYWRSHETFGQTPSRLRWQGKMLEFPPPILCASGKQGPRIFAARNISALGSLSEPFGLFQNAELHRKSWSGLALESDWKAELPGYIAAMSLAPSPLDPTDLAVAVVSTLGQSSVWIYDP